MKKIITILLLILSLTIIYGWDEEDDVNNLTRISLIENNVIDFNVNSPANTLSPEINFRTGFILNDKLRLGISGRFLNVLDYFYNQQNSYYASNGDGTPSYKNQEIVKNSYQWSQLDNILSLYLGWRFLDILYFNFLINGGSDYNKVGEIIEEKKFKYNPDGSLNSTNPGVDDLQKSNKSILGYSFLNTGFGVNILKDFFYTELINSLDIKTNFSVKFGSGLPYNLISLSDIGISTGFDGNNSDLSQVSNYYKNGSINTISYKIKDEESFKYISFLNDGYAEINLDFHNVFSSLSSFNRLRLIPGLGYYFEIYSYYESIDKKDYSFNDNVLGYFKGDYRNTKSVYNINYLISVGGSLPIALDLRPVSFVQMRFSYAFDIKSTIIDYKVKYYENRTINGVDSSFQDPLISVNSSQIDFNHKIGVRFRYEFPKYVRMSIGANYTINHSLYNNEIKIPHNTRLFSNGTKGEANYDIQNSTNIDFSSYPYNNPFKIGWVNQSITPYLEFDIEFIKDFATLTINWLPLIAWSNNGNDDLTDTNLLNLANWKIVNVIKFNKAKFDSINYKPITRKDTYDQIVILHTNDHHGQIFPFDIYPAKNIGGVAARANLIKDIKSQYKNVLLLDAGDINTGSPESNFFKGFPDIEAYNYMNYDAVCIGNHEFDITNKEFLDQIKNAKFQFLSANVKTKDGKYLAKPYIIKNMGGIRVAIFGLTTTETIYIGNKEYIKDLVFEDEVEVAKRIVPELRKVADVVILLGHLGLYDDNKKGSRRVAREVSGIDLIIDGHTHTEMSKPFYENGIPIVQATKWGIVVGKAVLTFKNKKLINISWEALPVNVKDVIVKENGEKVERQIGKQYDEDKNLTIKLRKYRESVNKILDEVIGDSATYLSIANVRKEETEIGNLVADSMQYFASKYNVDFSFQNSGGIRKEINSGSITKRNVYETLPFDNTIVILTMKGEDLLEMFNYIATIKPGNDGAFPQVSKELRFTINYDTFKCENILINGEPFDVNKTYRIATNSYLADGGNNYTMFKKAIEKYDTSVFQRDVLIEYIKNIKNIIPKIDGRIKKIGKGVSFIKLNNLKAA